MAPVDDMEDELVALRLLAIQQLLDAVAAADMSSPSSAALSLTRSFTDVVEIFGEQAAMSAARYLELDREQATVSLPSVIPAETVPFEQIERSLNWALRPLETGDMERVERQLAGSLQRMVEQPARETVFDNVVRAGTRYARIPRADACAFCLMLGSRGAVYLTEYTAERTTGRSTPTSGRPPGLEYHDNCRCVSREVRDDNENVLPDITGRLTTIWADSGASSLDEFAEYLRENPLAEGVRY